MQIRVRSFALALLAAMIAGGVVTGGVFFQFQSRFAAGPGQSASDLSKVDAVYQVLSQGYVTPVERSKLVEGAIDGMVKALEDPYTTYMTPKETQGWTESISSKFEGIGAEIREENEKIMVVTPIHGAPAEKAGLKPGDFILEANGVSLSGMKVSEAVTHIRGPKGTEAKLRIERPGQGTPFEVTIIRDTIPLLTVFAEMRGDQVGVVRISKVSETTSQELVKALADLKGKGARGIVLDLRQNPGGLLSEAVRITEQFVPKGQLILQVKERDGSVRTYRSEGKKSDMPVVVLIDKGSASAAEIIAGAMKESAGIPLVGETTFGKGTVQTTADLEDGSSLKYTMAQWLTPNGNQINKQGIKPDVEVKLPDYADLPYPMVEKEYKLGQQAEPVQTVQKMLKVLGHDPGREDGLIDERTAGALKAFQGANGLPQTGALDPATALKVTMQLQQKIKENDTQMGRAVEILRERMK